MAAADDHRVVALRHPILPGCRGRGRRGARRRCSLREAADGTPSQVPVGDRGMTDGGVRGRARATRSSCTSRWTRAARCRSWTSRATSPADAARRAADGWRIVSAGHVPDRARWARPATCSSRAAASSRRSSRRSSVYAKADLTRTPASGIREQGDAPSRDGPGRIVAPGRRRAHLVALAATPMVAESGVLRPWTSDCMVQGHSSDAMRAGRGRGRERRTRTAYWPPAHQEEHVSVGTAFHPRTAPLNRKMQWREWSGYYASSAYADAHDIEYNAIREAAARHRRQPAVQVPRHRPRRDPPRRPRDHPRRDEAQGRAGLLHALVRRARQGHRRRHGPPRRRATSSAGRPPTRSSAG